MTSHSSNVHVYVILEHHFSVGSKTGHNILTTVPISKGGENGFRRLGQRTFYTDHKPSTDTASPGLVRGIDRLRDPKLNKVSYFDDMVPGPWENNIIDILVESHLERTLSEIMSSFSEMAITVLAYLHHLRSCGCVISKKIFVSDLLNLLPTFCSQFFI